MAPKLSVLRRGPAEFDFSGCPGALFKGGESAVRGASSAKWTVVLDRSSVRRLTAALRDLTTSPESDWRIDELNLETRGLTIGGARPGREPSRRSSS